MRKWRNYGVYEARTRVGTVAVVSDERGLWSVVWHPPKSRRVRIEVVRGRDCPENAAHEAERVFASIERVWGRA